MRLWHKWHAWLLGLRARHERRRLARFIRQSVGEIRAWKQEIAGLEKDAARHRALAEPSWQDVAAGNVVPFEQKAA